jgi:hypothetical protein
MAIAVDYLCVMKEGDALGVVFEYRVNVAVDEISWRKAGDEASIGFKSAVTEILGIVNEARRRMGHNDIHPFVPPQGRQEPEYRSEHLHLGVLKGAAVVPSGSLQTHDFQTFEFDEAAMHVDASDGRSLSVADVMVSGDVKQRSFENIAQKGEIFGRQIAASQDQLHAFVTLGRRPVIQGWLYAIRNRKDFHGWGNAQEKALAAGFGM